jgi:cell division protein FtsW (lipid II flippase)
VQEYTPQNERIQHRLVILAAIFLLIYSITLTLSPAGRARSWDVDYRWSHWIGYFVWLIMLVIANRYSARYLPERDPYLLPIAALLSGWGLMTIWRLIPEFGIRQTYWITIAIGVFTVGLRLPSNLDFLRRYKYIWLITGLALTALTLGFGTNPLGLGPRMWLGCCGVYFQPSEPLKLLLIIYLSAYLAQRLPQLEKTSNKNTKRSQLLALLTPTLLMTGLALALLIFQRDLGTASIYLFLYTSIVYIASGRREILWAGIVILILSGIVGHALFDVVRLRVDAWLNPWIDPSGRSYQIVQSLLAVANGGILGRGAGLGNPGLVPIPHSDFIFPAITEESGLIGALGLLLLMGLLLGRGIRVAISAREPFHNYLAAGLTAFLVGQSLLIMGGNLRLFPLTGVTLPFMSYGGSSLLTTWICILLLLHISNAEGTDHAIERPEARPHLHLAIILLAGLVGVALVLGWWAVYRGPDLLTRTDNPRRSISDRFVPRGAILDRNNQLIAATSGTPGDLSRQLLYPPLSPIIGYTNPVYGQSGLEASLDAYLRGLQGNPQLSIWWNHLLYGQPPPGLDVRLSLDMELQQAADQALAGRRGAIVLMDAKTGDILAMVSSPGFDANQLEAQWEALVNDPDSPLLNRATQGFYPLGILLDSLLPSGASPAEVLSVPQIRLPATEPLVTTTPTASPLQLSLLAAALTNGGILPAPLLVQAVKTPLAGWVLLPSLEDNRRLFTEEEADKAIESLTSANLPLWHKVAVATLNSGQSVTWFIGGILPRGTMNPFAVAVLLEEDSPTIAEEIGRSILQAR